MAKVTGFGGIILYSNDPKRLVKWYKENLGIEFGNEDYTFFYWLYQDNPEKVGKTLVEIVPPIDENHKFDQKKSSVTISFCVDNLEEMLESLRGMDGVVVYDEIREIVDGWIGWFDDIDGNKVELWEQK